MKDTNTWIFHGLVFFRMGFLVVVFVVVFWVYLFALRGCGFWLVLSVWFFVWVCVCVFCLGFFFSLFSNLNCRVHFLPFFLYQQASKRFALWGLDHEHLGIGSCKMYGLPSVDNSQLFTFTLKFVQECSCIKFITVKTLQLSSSQLNKITVICEFFFFLHCSLLLQRVVGIAGILNFLLFKEQGHKEKF